MGLLVSGLIPASGPPSALHAEIRPPNLRMKCGEKPTSTTSRTGLPYARTAPPSQANWRRCGIARGGCLAAWRRSASPCDTKLGAAARATIGPPNKTGKESRSFLKKRTKKLLQGCRRLVRDSRAKVFASFFKKKRFLTSISSAPRTSPSAPTKPQCESADYISPRDRYATTTPS